MESLLKNIKLTRVFYTSGIGAGSSIISTTDSTGALGKAIDMAGFDGIMCIISPSGTIAAGSLGLTPKMSASSSALTADSSAASFIGSTDGATTDFNNQLIALDLVKPKKRWVGFQLMRATQNSVADGIVIQYNYSKGPTVQSTAGVAVPGGVAYSTALIEPGEAV